MPTSLVRITGLVTLALLVTACGSSATVDASTDAAPTAETGADAARDATPDVATPDVAPLDSAVDATVRDASADSAPAPDVTPDVAPDSRADVPVDVPEDAPADVPPPVVYCGHPADCAIGTTCAADGLCKPGPCSDTLACIYGYTCGSDGVCAAPSPLACDVDGECAGMGPGAACVDGTCTPASALCFDGSQCAAPGAKCRDGKCVPACASDDDCPAGFGCDLAHGTCSVPRTSCAITNDCGGPSAVCVGGVCVPRSLGGACPSPAIWVENGCVPSAAIAVVCSTTGVRAECAAGSICIDHTCFLSCDAPNQNACASQPVLNDCKPVSTPVGTFNVCGTARNLGNQCNPTIDMPCADGAVCIDGFCQ